MTGLSSAQAAELVRESYGHCTPDMVRGWIRSKKLTRRPDGLIEPAALLHCVEQRKRVARRPRKVDPSTS